MPALRKATVPLECHDMKMHICSKCDGAPPERKEEARRVLEQNQHGASTAAKNIVCCSRVFPTMVPRLNCRERGIGMGDVCSVRVCQCDLRRLHAPAYCVSAVR